jgi:uncharacterized membrane protein
MYTNTIFFNYSKYTYQLHDLQSTPDWNLVCEFLDLIWFSEPIYKITDSRFYYLQTTTFLLQVK